MKKLILITMLAFFAIAVNAQGLFRPVTDQVFNTTTNSIKAIGDQSAWAWRFDATFAISQQLYNKDTKELEASFKGGVGPFIGYQHFVPKSAIDPTPVNNYGVGLGFLVGDKFTIALQGNLWQYLKGGITYTTGLPDNYFPLGFFVGTGITF